MPSAQHIVSVRGCKVWRQALYVGGLGEVSVGKDTALSLAGQDLGQIKVRAKLVTDALYVGGAEQS